MDLEAAAVGAQAFESAAAPLDLTVVTLSARRGSGLAPLISHLLRMLAND
jgi:hypothetical protein